MYYKPTPLFRSKLLYRYRTLIYIYMVIRIISPWCIISPPPSSGQTSCIGIGRLYMVIRIISPWCIISPPPSSGQSYCIGIGRLYMVIRIISPWCIISPTPLFRADVREIAHGLIIRTIRYMCSAHFSNMSHFEIAQRNFESLQLQSCTLDTRSCPLNQVGSSVSSLLGN